MKINFCFEKKKWLWFAGALILSGVLSVLSGALFLLPIVFSILFYLIVCMEIVFDEKGSLIVIPGILLLSGCVSFLTVQRIILDMNRFTRISAYMALLNILSCLMIHVFVFFITARPVLTCVLVQGCLNALAVFNNLIYQFREDEFYPGALMRISALNARTEGFTIEFKERITWGILCFILFTALLQRCRMVFRSYWRQRAAAGVISAVFCVTMTLLLSDISMETWREKGSYQNGYVVNFILGIRDQQMIDKPSGYSSESVNEIASEYIKKASENETAAENAIPSGTDTEKPVIISIMSEAFTDFGNLGPVSANQEVMPFYDSLTENTIRGYALASVFGAKTPNSEWEYLTGNTMGFLPGGSVAFQQFINEEPFSMVTSLKEQDYTCVAMHPYYSGGFSRTTNYSNMGFDEKYFLENFNYMSYDQTLRGYVTDKQLFGHIIDIYEDKEQNENLYIHAVTMQNHRPYYGYYSKLRNERGNIIRTIGTQYEDVNNYLSLLHESDAALEELISYFERQDRKVVIVFFGDHMPSLNNTFYSSLNGKGLSGLTMNELEALYKVPFFIWTNYDTQEEYVDCTSLNFLSTMTLERAGLSLTPYNEFLKEMKEVIPAVNSRGYYSVDEGGFRYITEAEGEEKKWLNKYHQLQYNNMFDKNRNTEMFPFIPE